MHPTLRLRVTDVRIKIWQDSRRPLKESILRIGRTTRCLPHALCFQTLTAIRPHRCAPSIVSISIPGFEPLFVVKEFFRVPEDNQTVHPMTKREQNRVRQPDYRWGDPRQMMDVLLALDRMLVEVSMRLYNLPRHEQSAMRKQNRHLHRAVREQLPHLLQSSRRRP